MTMSIAPLPDDAGDGAEIFEALSDDDPTGFQARAVSVGNEFKHVAREWLGKAGATFVRDHHMVGSYHVEGLICGTNQRQFLVLAHGVLDDDNQAGLKRSDTVKKACGGRKLCRTWSGCISVLVDESVAPGRFQNSKVPARVVEWVGG